MRILKQFWNRIGLIGYRKDLSEMAVTRLIICNQFAVIWILTLLLFYFKFIFWNNLTEVYVFPAAIIVFCAAIAANYYERYRLSKVISLGALPILELYLLILFGNSLGLEYGFLILIISSIILVDRYILRVIYVIYNILLYLVSFYYLENNDPLLDHSLSSSVRLAVFIVTVICMAVLTLYVIKKFEFYLRKKTEFLNTVEEKNKKLSAALEEIERFTYLTSHDLKTPLRSIISFTGLIEKQNGFPPDEKTATYFSFIKKEAFQLDNLVNDVLEYLQMTNPDELKYEWLNLNLIVDDHIDELKSSSGKSITVSKEKLPALYSNFEYVNILISHLLQNAVIYNNEDVRLTISHEIKDSEITLIIEDNGIGVKPEFHEQIFGMFKRLHNDENYTGNGIGLAICKKITDSLGGKISIDSEINKGSRFYIQLPNVSKDVD